MRSIDQGYSIDKVTRQGYGLTENDDATGLNHTWFRKNESQAGRWTSPDPYKGSMSLGDPQSFNRYSYVGNQPTNYVDPSGLMCFAVYYTEYILETGQVISHNQVGTICTGSGMGLNTRDRSGIGNGNGQTEGKISGGCKQALKKAGLLKKVESRWNTAKIYDVDKIQDQKGQDYFGKRAAGMTVGEYFDRRAGTDPGDAFVYTSWATGKATARGRPGIYARGGEVGMGDDVRTHETAHLAWPRGRDLDISLAAKLKVPYEKTKDAKQNGENASNALSEFFRNDCKN